MSHPACVEGLVKYIYTKHNYRHQVIKLAAKKHKSNKTVLLLPQTCKLIRDTYMNAKWKYLYINVK